MQELEVGPPVRPFLSAPKDYGDVVVCSRNSCLRYIRGEEAENMRVSHLSALSFRSTPQASRKGHDHKQTQSILLIR